MSDRFRADSHTFNIAVASDISLRRAGRRFERVSRRGGPRLRLSIVCDWYRGDRVTIFLTEDQAVRFVRALEGEIEKMRGQE